MEDSSGNAQIYAALNLSNVYPIKSWKIMTLPLLEFKKNMMGLILARSYLQEIQVYAGVGRWWFNLLERFRK